MTWEWMQDPIKRNLWNGGHVTWSLGDRPIGRAGAGASNHCAHGKSNSTEVILDWRPFEYSTSDSYENGKKGIHRNDALRAASERRHARPRPASNAHAHAAFAKNLMLKFVLLYQHQYEAALRRATELASEEFAKATSDES